MEGLRSATEKGAESDSNTPVSKDTPILRMLSPERFKERKDYNWAEAES
jgi:hypothetical protein